MVEKILRFEILKVLKESENGLTLTQLSKKLGETIYTINSEVCKLEGANILEVIKVGSSNLVRIK